MLRDVLVRGFNSETGQQVTCITNRRDNSVSENPILSLRTFKLKDGDLHLTTHGLAHFPQVLRAFKSFKKDPTLAEKLGNGCEGVAYRTQKHSTIVIKRLDSNLILRSPEQRILTMETISQAVSDLGIDYLRVPKQYGYISANHEKYIIMQHVPGVNLEAYFSTRGIQSRGISNALVEQAFNEAKSLIDNYFNKNVISLDRYNPSDFRLINVLINTNERSSRYPFVLYVLDQ
ncbi:MAG TPA: hypothetical protein VF189_05280 [Patescibacteria group bacterium]